MSRLFQDVVGELSKLPGIGRRTALRLAIHILRMELILAISTSVEGETTLFYLMNRLRQFPELKVTSIARGIGFGDELEYVDELTITHALLNRREVE